MWLITLTFFILLPPQKREYLANVSNKENEMSSGNVAEQQTATSSDYYENGVDRQSKLSSSEPNSVLDVRSDLLNNPIASTELFKPILKRKVY